MRAISFLLCLFFSVSARADVPRTDFSKISKLSKAKKVEVSAALAAAAFSWEECKTTVASLVSVKPLTDLSMPMLDVVCPLDDLTCFMFKDDRDGEVVMALKFSEFAIGDGIRSYRSSSGSIALRFAADSKNAIISEVMTVAGGTVARICRGTYRALTLDDVSRFAKASERTLRR